MRNIRRQPREEVDLNEIIKQPSKEIKPEKKKQSIISNSSNSIVAIMKLGLTANEIKLLEAIESEKIAENENIPAMSTNYICSKYKINHFFEFKI